MSDWKACCWLVIITVLLWNMFLAYIEIRVHGMPQKFTDLTFSEAFTLFVLVPIIAIILVIVLLCGLVILYIAVASLFVKRRSFPAIPAQAQAQAGDNANDVQPIGNQEIFIPMDVLAGANNPVEQV